MSSKGSRDIGSVLPDSAMERQFLVRNHPSLYHFRCRAMYSRCCGRPILLRTSASH